MRSLLAFLLLSVSFPSLAAFPPGQCRVCVAGAAADRSHEAPVWDFHGGTEASLRAESLRVCGIFFRAAGRDPALCVVKYCRVTACPETGPWPEPSWCDGHPFAPSCRPGFCSSHPQDPACRDSGYCRFHPTEPQCRAGG